MAPTTYTPPINTYVPLESIVLTNAASSVTFFNIAQSDANGTYKDLVLVFAGTTSASIGILSTYNGDTSNQSRVFMYAPPGTSGTASDNEVIYAYTSQSVCTMQILDYSATDKHKTILARSDNAAVITMATAQRWASTSAISSIALTPKSGNTFGAGSTFSLYALHG